VLDIDLIAASLNPVFERREIGESLGDRGTPPVSRAGQVPEPAEFRELGFVSRHGFYHKSINHCVLQE
jgi:hypothetical protein